MSCEQCTQGHVLPGEPAGSIVDGAYFHPGPESGNKDFAIVVLTDIFGLPLKNSKIIADELSKRLGCDVWVPDMFDGKPVFKEEELAPLTQDLPGDPGFWSQLRFLWLALTHVGGFIRNRPAVVDARVIEFVKKVKEPKGYKKLGAIGYCFGGSVAIRLGATETFDSLVIAHPGITSLNEIKQIKVPSAWICAEGEMTFKAPLRNQAEAAFAARKDKPDYIDYEFKDYKGTFHGFAARPNLGIPHIAEAYRAALDQAVAWLQKTLGH